MSNDKSKDSMSTHESNTRESKLRISSTICNSCGLPKHGFYPPPIGYCRRITCLKDLQSTEKQKVPFEVKCWVCHKTDCKKLGEIINSTKHKEYCCNDLPKVYHKVPIEEWICEPCKLQIPDTKCKIEGCNEIRSRVSTIFCKDHWTIENLTKLNSGEFDNDS